MSLINADKEPVQPPFFDSWSDFLSRHGRCRETYDRFRTVILHHYLHHERQFSWRTEITPYRVVVSELMLQQTQTARVEPKFASFTARFPDFRSLAGASFAEVLQLWKGLGYNRRAKYLQEIAVTVVDRYGGRLPDDPEVLVTFPGIGRATAASICVFAFNRPIAFVETNIRTVFLHFFYTGKIGIHDREILDLVEQSMDRQQPRRWFYALMDYGVMLKKTVGNLNRNSRHYSRQSAFAGSDRQLRGRILQLLLDRCSAAPAEVAELLGEEAERVDRLIGVLCDEGIIVRRNNALHLD